MRVSWKYTLLLVLLIAGLNLFLWVFSQTVLLQNFIEHEEMEMHDHISRVLYEIEHELQDLAILAYDWGAWDDTYRYMQARGRLPGYVESNLGDETWVDLRLSLVAFVARDGELVFAKNIKPDVERVSTLSAEHLDFIRSQAVLWQGADAGKQKKGLVSVAGVPTLLVVQPVLESGGEGAAVGSLIFGRSFDEGTLEELGERTRLDLTLVPYAAQKISTNYVVSLGGDLEHFEYASRENDVDELFGQVRLDDIFGNPSLFLQVGMSRHVYRQEVLTIRYFLLLAAVASTLAGFFIWLIMGRLSASSVKIRKSEQEYKKLSFEFQAILDGIKSSVTLISTDLKVVWANRAAMGEMGIYEWESGSSRITDRIDASGYRETNDLVLRAMRDGHYLEAVQDRDDDRKVGVKVFPLLDDDSAVTGVVKLEADITEKFLLRKEVQRAGHLAALGELSAGIAHEVNNPNGMILRNLGLIADVFNDAWPILDREAKKNPGIILGGLSYARIRDDLPALIKDMKGGSLRIKAIVEDLKTFARADDTADQFDDIDLNVVVQTCQRLTSGPVRQKTHNFQTLLAADLPTVKGNSRQIEQVVINLIMNASQALTDPGQKIEIRTSLAPDGNSLMLVVEDEGRGISPDDFDKITDPFYTTKRDSGGTGLGLSVSARIVEKHGGKLHFSSTVDSGTTVSLFLPLSRKD